MSLTKTPKHLAWATLAAAGLWAGMAQASVIQLQTRAGDVSALYPDAATAKADVEALVAAGPTAGYCDTAVTLFSFVSNHSNCAGVTGNIAFKITTTFEVSAAMAGLWSFRLGPDLGWGGALFLDGVAIDFKSDDLWWSGSFANPAELLAGGGFLLPGVHSLTVYGSEPCCDGGNTLQYQSPLSQEWSTFSIRDGLTPTTTVPEPTSLALLLTAGGLAAWRRRRSA